MALPSKEKRRHPKKVLIVSSSPRKEGNSDVLCDRFARGASEVGHGVEKIMLRDGNLGQRGWKMGSIKDVRAVEKQTMDILHRVITTQITLFKEQEKELQVLFKDGQSELNSQGLFCEYLLTKKK